MKTENDIEDLLAPPEKNKKKGFVRLFNNIIMNIVYFLLCIVLIILVGINPFYKCSHEYEKEQEIEEMYERNMENNEQM